MNSRRMMLTLIRGHKLTLTQYAWLSLIDGTREAKRKKPEIASGSLIKETRVI